MNGKQTVRDGYARVRFRIQRTAATDGIDVDCHIHRSGVITSAILENALGGDLFRDRGMGSANAEADGSDDGECFQFHPSVSFVCRLKVLSCLLVVIDYGARTLPRI